MATAENVWRLTGGIAPLKTEGIPSMIKSPGRMEDSQPKKKGGGIFGVLDFFFRKEDKEPPNQLEHYLDLSHKCPGNATVHLKIAEIYQRQGEEEKAIGKFLQAAEIFFQDNFFPQAMAIYKHVLSINSHLVHVNQKMAEIYRKTGFWADAISQLRIVAKHYEQWGKKERLPEILKAIQELESQRLPRENKAQDLPDSPKPAMTKSDPFSPPAFKMVPPGKAAKEAVSPEGIEKKQDLYFDLRAQLATTEAVDLKSIKEIPTDKLFGFEEIFKELQETVIPAEVYPDFHYHMGMACREMGFNDGAIEQLQMAFENGQKPAESARLLSKCFREKGWFHEAQKYFEKAMKMEDDSRKRTSGFTSELVLVHS